MSTVSEDKYEARQDERAHEFVQPEVLARLLTEYSGKIKILTEQESKLRNKRFLLLTIVPLLWGLAVATLLMLVGEEANTFIARKISLIGMIALTAVSVLVYYSLWQQERRKVELTDREREIAILKFEPVVRIASQFLEHSTKDPNVRLELSLRLVEAESALRWARRFSDIRPDAGKG